MDVFELSDADLRANLRGVDGRMAEQLLDKADIKAYEVGQFMPSADAIKRIALAFSLTMDELIFDAHERQPADNLRLAFEGPCQI